MTPPKSTLTPSHQLAETSLNLSASSQKLSTKAPFLETLRAKLAGWFGMSGAEEQDCDHISILLSSAICGDLRCVYGSITNQPIAPVAQGVIIS